MTSFEAALDEYSAVRAELARLIDSPDKTVSVSEYRAQLEAAKAANARAHEAFMAVWP